MADERARFQDRYAAGWALAAHLGDYAGRDDVIVLGLPRGGVPVASEVAKALDAPLDVLVVRKVGVPHQPELAMGAIASGGVLVRNLDVLQALGISDQVFETAAAVEERERARRERVYRGDVSNLDLRGKIVLLVDDGLATGATMRAAIPAVRALGAEHVVVAVPTAPDSTCTELASEADEVICATRHTTFSAVGQFYDDFTQTTDAEVVRLLRENGRRMITTRPPSRRAEPVRL